VLSDAPEARVSPETRARIKQAAADLAYRPNFAGRALKFSRTNVIALVVPDLTNAFVTELMLGVEDEALERDYMVLLGRSEDLQPGGEMVSRLIGEGRVDGMLVQVADHARAAEIAELVEARYPIVFLNSIQAGHRGGVVLDDEAGARLATEHLLGLGHRRIAMVGGLPQSYTAGRRVTGFQEAMAAAGLPVPATAVTRLGYYPKDGRQALRRLVDQATPPTGLVVANLNAAIGVLSEARSLGLQVPEDLSVISVHDAWTAENTWPPLTTVKMPMYQLGRAAVAGLYARLHGAEVRDHVVTDPAPQLVLRQSTRPR
jgi:LacI family transcriptional regulator